MVDFQAITSWISLQIGLLIFLYFFGVQLPDWLTWLPTIAFGAYLILSALGWLFGVLFGTSRKRNDDYHIRDEVITNNGFY